MRSRVFRYFLLLISAWNCLSFKAQSYPEFIRVEKNKIVFDKDSSDFYKFITHLKNFQSKRETRISIIHFGGSHVQGGFWSEAMMHSFQNYFHTRGGGYFVFPFKQVKTNTPYYFKTYSNGKWRVNKCTKVIDSLSYLGMCGISAITDTSCYLAIKNQSPTLMGFTRIKIFYRKNPSYSVQPQFATSSIIDSEFFTEYVLQQKTDSVSFIIQKKDSTLSDFILDGISCENDSSGLYYAGFGVNGATSESFLKCALLLDQLKHLKVDLFILSFGVNDVRDKAFSKEKYIENYDRFIAILRQAHPESAILLTTISDNYIKKRQVNLRTRKGNEAMYEIMRKYQLAIWDLNAIMGGEKSMMKWYKAGLSAKDKIHFNKKGYFILGELMTKAILQHLKK